MARKQTSPVSIPTPIVTILGHVDHGKTTLLDTIRKTNIASREAGGITQHIGAYQIQFQSKSSKSRTITFIDTPGHEAFAKMRARGATVANIAVLVVAANDGLMPQTIESLAHIKEANIPFIVAATKTDLSEANLEKIKQQLTKQGVTLEEYGGDVPLIPISAKLGKGIDKLLEMILLVTELQELKEDSTGAAKAVVIEAALDKGKGPIVRLIVKNGTFAQGDEIVTGDGEEAKVRVMFDQFGKEVKTAPPGTPVELLGLSHVIPVGTVIYKKKDEALIVRPKKEIVLPSQPGKLTTPDETGLVVQKLKIILKTDNSGSLEAILGSLHGKDSIQLTSSSTGSITESDVLLAKSSSSIIIGFHTKPSSSVVKLAQSEKVMIKTYTIIYEMLDEIDDVAQALQTGGLEEVFGEARVLAVFDIKEDKIAGLKVISGRIARGDKVKIMRGDKEIGRTRLKSLKHQKEDITKAEQGKEAGATFQQKLDFLPNDSIIAIG